MTAAGPERPPASERVDVGAVTLAVLRRPGPGVGVLLVHGLASNARLWDGVALELAAGGHDVTAVDLRGHGRSDRPDTGYRVQEVAADLAGLIDRLRLARPVVVGQSWGGNVAVQLAADHPGSTRGLVCVDGGYIDLQAGYPSWPECARALAPPEPPGSLAELEEIVRAAHPDWPETGVQGLLACFEETADATLAPRLSRARHLQVLRGLWEQRPVEVIARVPVPVVLLAAGTWPDPAAARPDPAAAAKRAAVARAAAACPWASVVWMEGDHDLHAQRPREVAEVISQMARTAR